MARRQVNTEFGSAEYGAVAAAARALGLTPTGFLRRFSIVAAQCVLAMDARTPEDSPYTAGIRQLFAATPAVEGARARVHYLREKGTGSAEMDSAAEAVFTMIVPAIVAAIETQSVFAERRAARVASRIGAERSN